MPLSDEHQAAPGAAPVATRDVAAPVGRARRAPCPVADGREHRLDPNSIPAGRLSGAIFGTILSLLQLVGVVIASFAGSLSLARVLLLLGGWLAVSLLIAALVLGWPVLSYRHTSYEVDGRGMRIRRGVLWRTVSSVPRTRVQHTDVSQGPIERMFELATLVIYTAGTQNASISLGGLGRDTAFAIRDHLLAGGEDDAV
jgi:hypothetical protein